MTDEQLIAKAVAAGKVRIFPAGTTSDWDNIPLKERNAIMSQKNIGGFSFKNSSCKSG